jgi:hypothetical protein
MFSPNRLIFDDTASWTDNTCNQTMSIVDEIVDFDSIGFIESIFNEIKGFLKQ